MPRKTPPGDAATPLLEVASMRPRPDAAENLPGAPVATRPRFRFNEAAARCRGKLGAGVVVAEAVECFNEAAARCRGKRRLRHAPILDHPPASMRPRPDAAENVGL